MKTLLLALLTLVTILALLLTPGGATVTAQGQSTTLADPKIAANTVVVIPYQATSYKYQVFPQGGVPGNFGAMDFNDSNFPIGNAAFGSGGRCSIQTTVNTVWPINSEIVLRKFFTLPTGASNLRVLVSVDNDVQVFINGVDISSGLAIHEDCAVLDSFSFQAPDTILREGSNLLAVRAKDRGDESYVDFQVLVDMPTYSISGRVTNRNNNPVSDVTISSGSSLNTTTNASGYYTITNLITGTYTVAPDKSGYTFSPISRTVSVPPNATGKDFTATDVLNLILLEDHFDSENNGTWRENYSDFVNWDVTDGSVDLIGNGFADYFPSNGLYIDLDGGTYHAGTLASKATFILNPSNYKLQFDLAGSQRGDTNTVTVRLGSVYSESFTLDSDVPFTTITRNIPVSTASNGKLIFQHAGGDNIGLLLDNVKVERLVGAIYSISGRVMDTSNQTISSVTISTGAGLSTTTDASGYYTFTNLITGTYFITPTKSGYIFSPPSRSVSVPPNWTGQDFAGMILPGIGKPVVVLVPGWGGLTSYQSHCSEGITQYKTNQNFVEGDDPAKYMPGWLTRDGFDVWSAHLESGPSYTAPLRENAKCLRDQIAQVRRRDPGGKVILITHSMGGLVARAYLEDKGLYQNDVRMLFTLGSPHLGVRLEALVLLNQFYQFMNLDCLHQPAMCEFTGLGMAWFNIEHDFRPPGVNYYLVGGDLITSNATWIGRTLSDLFRKTQGPNDGIVLTTSALGLSGVRQTMQTHEAHIKEFGLSYLGILPGNRESISYIDCIQPVLKGNYDGCRSLVSSPKEQPNSIAQASEPSFTAFVPIMGNILTFGQQITQAISLDGSEAALFAASWVTGSITFTLTSPTSQIINSAYASTHPDQASYLESSPGEIPLGASYVITTAEAGQWTMNLQSGNLPGGSTNYFLLVAMESPITLSLQTDHSLYSAGQVASITATLGGGVTATNMVVMIQQPDQVTNTLMLSPQENGVYGGNYTVPVSPGNVVLAASASGVDGAGRPFSRQAITGFQVASPTVTLTNSYTDRAVDNDFDGRFESLEVNVGLSVTRAGSFTLSADLTAGNNALVSHIVTQTMLLTATQQIPLRFAGNDIRDFGSNGPFTLTNLLVSDDQYVGVPSILANNVWNTGTYNHNQFGNLLGDVNDDCAVNAQDVILVANTWRSRVGDNLYDWGYDLDHNGVVDIADIMLLVSQWGRTCP